MYEVGRGKNPLDTSPIMETAQHQARPTAGLSHLTRPSQTEVRT